MTAITVGTIGGQAFIVTDAGEEDEQERLVSIRSKVFRSEQFSLAIGYEGLASVDFIEWFARDKGIASQTEFLRLIPDLSRDMLAAGMREYSGDFEPMRHGHRLYIMAWRPDAGAVVAGCGTDQLSWGPDYEPFSLITIPGYTNMRVPACAELGKVGADLSAAAWRILEEQRAGPWPDGKIAVRGFGELVTVGPDGVRSEILGRWPEDDSLLKPERRGWRNRIKQLVGNGR